MAPAVSLAGPPGASNAGQKLAKKFFRIEADRFGVLDEFDHIDAQLTSFAPPNGCGGFMDTLTDSVEG